jgi:hypothetical protein
MRQIGRTTVLGIMVVATGIAVLASKTAWWDARAAAIGGIDARVVATNIPGASAISQVYTFLSGGTLMPGGCTNPSPIPTKFLGYTMQGARRAASAPPLPKAEAASHDGSDGCMLDEAAHYDQLSADADRAAQDVAVL